MHKNKYFYIFRNLVLPNLACIIIAYLVSLITKITSIKIWFGEIEIDKIKFISTQTLLIVLFYLIFIVFYIAEIQDKNKELIPSTVYGKIPFFIYAIASFLMRIKKINLKLKPTPLQFKIMSNSYLFEIDKLEEIDDDNTIEYNIVEKNEESRKINLVIADTYPFNNIELPTSVKNNKTYIIERKDKSTSRQRYNSKKLINLVTNIVEKNKNGCNEYNLFLFTNPKTNKSLYDKVFNTANDKIKLNLYNYDNDNKCFSGRPKYKIKC